MTLATTPPLFDYIENGVTLIHAIPFQFEASADIVCSRISGGVETVLTLGVDYTVAGGAGATGTVTKMTGGVNLQIFRIKRNTARAQSTDYTPGDAFPAETHEAALDRAMAIDQEQDVRIADLESRSLRFPAGEVATLLSSATARIGKLLGFDNAGAPKLYGTGDLRGDPGPSNNTYLTRAAIAALAVIVAFPGNSATLTEAGRAGSFVFRATNFAATYGASLAVIDPNQAVFIAPTSDPTGASGAWVRKAAEGGYYVSTWWGVTAGATAAANTLALRAATATLDKISLVGFGYITAGALPLYTPTGHYLLNDQITPESAIDYYGDSTLLGGGTVLDWSGSSGHGFNIRGWDGVSHHGTGSKVRKLTLKGWYAGPATRAAKHAVYVNGTSTVEDIFCSDWPGIAVYGYGDTGAANGTINLSVFRNIYAENCDLVLKLEGGDGNACVVSGIRGQSNRLGSYWDRGFLGNGASKIHAENNGLDPNFRSRCEKNGHIYVVALGQEAWCSTNSPTGTATSNLGWKYLNDGPVNFYTATWVTAQTWYFTAPVMIYSGGSTQGSATDCYIEGGQNPIILDAFAKCTTTTTAVVWQADGTPHGGYFRGNMSYMLFNNGLAWPGNTDAEGTLHGFGPIKGAANDVNFNFNSTNNFFVKFNRYALDGSLIQTDAQIAVAGGEMSINAVGITYFRFNGADVFTTVAGGLNLPAGKVLSVNGTQVVSARDTGWTAGTGAGNKGAFAAYAGAVMSAAYVQAEAQATNDAAKNASQRILAIEAALRAHGLIN